MQVGMALTPDSLARRKPGVQIPSPPPHNSPGHRPGGSPPPGRRRPRSRCRAANGQQPRRKRPPLLDRGHDDVVKQGQDFPTFRLRDRCSPSNQKAPDGSSLLPLDASSVQTAPGGAARPGGALRAIDSSACPRLLADLRLCAACSGNLSLPWVPPRVVRQDQAPAISCLPLAGRRGVGASGPPTARAYPDGVILTAAAVRMGRAYDPCPIDGTRRIRTRVTESTEQALLRERGAQ